MREAVPDALAATVHLGRTFDLVGGRRSAPEELVRKGLRRQAADAS
jgi:hypothetical protein